MTIVKRITDLSNYTTVLPYDSELFGIYQPLLGWKSKRIQERFQMGFQNDKSSILEKLKKEFAGLVDINYNQDSQINIQIKPGVLEGGKIRTFDSLVLQQISLQLPNYQNYQPDIWGKVITNDTLNAILNKNIIKIYTDAYSQLNNRNTLNPSSGMLMRAGNVIGSAINTRRIDIGVYEHQLEYESSIAGSLLFLVKQRAYDILSEIFYATVNHIEEATNLIKMLSADNSADAFLNIDDLDPTNKEYLDCVALSPISIVHLFRQYFFELDTFLGTPVDHVWLSPGSTVELIEIHTRSTTIERTLETTLDIITKSSTTSTTQDELSDAVKDDNQQDVSFGASVKASYASVEATSSFDDKTSQQTARETTHKQMRQQTEQLSSEIRKNYKSTFKTVTETTDVSSIKHTLTNTTEELINYELRRKMRQVGVQVQDVGSYLCWQTYVDDPGKELGIAELVHIAIPADLDSIPHPEEIPTFQPFQEEKNITIPFVSIDGSDADNKKVYVDGVYSGTEWVVFDDVEQIQADFAQEFVCSKANYDLTDVEFDPQGKPVKVSRKDSIQNLSDKAMFTLHLDYADFQGENSLDVALILHWAPKAGANDAIIQQNNANLANFKAKEKAEYEKAYVETVKDRVTLASKIQTRDSDDLREEERIIVYRQLIQSMLLNNVPLPDDRTRHVVAELINSIFDIDKMLYFVSPEWWRPRLHRSKQQLQETPIPVFNPSGPVVSGVNKVLQKSLMNKISIADLNSENNILSSSTVGWGGINEQQRDNYYITEDSDPAKLGSSLGWLLQLDGDNMRNAFLNAPWVKAVIPIRPGKEEAAINWLKGVEGMNGITDDVIYHTNNPEEKDINGTPLDGQKMIDVIMDLAKKIQQKYEEGIKTGKYPIPSEVSDPALVDDTNTVTATPIDRVYEHGFFPLQGGFRANVGKNYEIFDQWIEILPTDQIVPVEVKYDPKTGRQI
ncbi:peptidoglycan-binding protein [Legionella sainthelensi]|uniref:peptidoglycan-binding protein n=1 Tax=Legionella sainthelensi TaxID=28087 RepID=UPI000E20B972|nr:peptidoglycan-binding protein [Legionella sainthelensi]